MLSIHFILSVLIGLWSLPSVQAAEAARPAMTLTQGNTRFALELYQQIRDEGGGNVFFSPYSISTALGLTYVGARGETASEMARVMHFDLPTETLARAFADLANRFEAVQAKKQVQLAVANSLWPQQGSRLRPEFLDLCQRQFHARVCLLDYVKAREAARQAINGWVEKKTQDKIKALLQPDDLTALTRLVLCNAIYFKGDWAKQFDPKATRPAPFFLAPGRSVDVSLMHQKARVKALTRDGFHVVELPYAGGDLSMIVLLPEAVDGLPRLEQQLRAETLREWLDQMDRSPAREAQIYLPRFKANFRVDLGRALEAMGMRLAFTSDADFSGIDRTNRLCISKVIHQAFVDVNEQGTEAAAATAVIADRAPAPPALVFRADHPFLFLIREKLTGSFLFAGRIADPSK
jgi:serpin B